MLFVVGGLSKATIFTRSVRSNAYPQDDSTMGEMVECHRFACQFPGTATRQWGDQRTQFDALGGHCHRGQCHPGIAHGEGPTRPDVVPEEEAIPPSRFCLMGYLSEQARITVVAEIRGINSKLHRHAPFHHLT